LGIKQNLHGAAKAGEYSSSESVFPSASPERPQLRKNPHLPHSEVLLINPNTSSVPHSTPLDQILWGNHRRGYDMRLARIGNIDYSAKEPRF